MLNFRDYLSYAEKHLLHAEDGISKSLDVNWLLIPATILTWSAIESFVNNRLDDFGSLPDGMFELHERAFLLEKRIKLEDKGDKIGQFVLEGAEYSRLEDKIFFLVTKFGNRGSLKVKRGDTLWQEFQELKDARDALVHPKQNKQVLVSIEKVRKFIETSKEVIQLVSLNMWNKRVQF